MVATSPLPVEGYATIPRSIQRDPNISWRAKLVYLALSSRADRYHRCFPSLETIAAEASCSVSSAKRALIELRDLGLIHWKSAPPGGEGREGRPPNIYTLGAPASFGSERADTPEFRLPETEFRVSESRVSGLRDLRTNTTNEPTNELPLTPSPDLASAFASWWALYPKKVDKREAEKRFAQVVKNGDATVEELLAGVQRWAAAWRGIKDLSKCRGPVVWLNRGSWADETVTAYVDAPVNGHRPEPPPPAYSTRPARPLPAEASAVR